MADAPVPPRPGLRVAAIGECMIELALRPSAGAAAGRLGEAQVGFGGDTLNTAVYLARAAAEHEPGPAGLGVWYVTALGDDALSDAMVDAWRAEGLEVDLVERLAGRLPGLYLIRTDGAGERTFYYWRESAAARELLDAERAQRLAARLAGFDLVYLSGITAAILDGPARERLLGLLDRLRGGGTRIALDSNYRPRLWSDPETARRALTECARRADIGLPSAADEMSLYADSGPHAVAERWRGLGVEEVVVKDGAAPAVVAHRGGLHEVPPPAAIDPLDTTAAGDSFNAAYLAARLQGRPPAAAAQEGHALAARVIQHRGALMPRAGPNSPPFL